jgi:hypothetical protein
VAEPQSASVRVSLPDEFGNETVQSANPPTSVPVALTWTGTGYVVPMAWDVTNPIDQANEQNATLLIGIWGSTVVAVPRRSPIFW